MFQFVSAKLGCCLCDDIMHVVHGDCRSSFPQRPNLSDILARQPWSEKRQQSTQPVAVLSLIDISFQRQRQDLLVR